MPSLLTRKFGAFLAQSFVYSMATNTAVVYMYVGHPQEWVDSANIDVGDSNPPIPFDTTQEVDFEVWRDIIGLKRVVSSNVAFVVSRNDWVANTVYDQYDDIDTDLLSVGNFYVLDTTDVPYKVYKCLWNDNGGESTQAPSAIGTPVTPQATADGYVWQYMYSILSDNIKFLTPRWMPVLSDTDVISAAVAFPGRLPISVPLAIVEAGTGYNANTASAVTIDGDGSGANVTSNGISVLSGAISSVYLANGGIRYTEVANATVSQNGVSNSAIVRAIIPPYPNHGADPVKELGAAALLLCVSFAEDESGQLTTSQDFRRYGLLVNPLDANGDVATSEFYRQTYDLTFTSNTGILAPDDVIFNLSKSSEPTAIVVDVVPGSNANYIVRLTRVRANGETDPFEEGETIKCDESGVEVTIDSVSVPELTPYSGNVVFINQRTPVTRGADQVEEFRLVIPFA